MWLEPVDKSTLEEALFHFLLSVRDGRPEAKQPLVAEENTLHALYAEPHPDLWEALRHCLDAFLVELSPNPAQRGELHAPVSALGVALAANNCLAPASLQQPGGEEKHADPVVDFTTALIATLPPALVRDTALTYHAVLRGSEITLPHLEGTRAGLLHSLIERSPLTALWSLDAHTPAALDELAAELLPGWSSIDGALRQIWRGLEQWLERVVELLADASISRWLRHRWLTMPETREACRNVGLLLEALRQREEQRNVILDFYEAYDYFRAEPQDDEWRGQVRVWPVLETIAELLLTSGDNEESIQRNRQGNEYFLKFLPLVQLIINEGGVPTDYAHLSREFVGALRPLLNYVTEGARQRITFEKVVFEERRE